MTFCVAVRVHGPQISYLPVLAFSLRHSNFARLRIYVINTDNRTDLGSLSRMVRFINELVQEDDFLVLLDLGPIPVLNNYGYGVTDQALSYLYQQYEKNASLCQYLLITNGDNLYSRYLAAKITPHMQAGKDLIAWTFVSRYYLEQYREKINPNDRRSPEVIDDGTQKTVPVSFRVQGIDLGAIAYRVAFLHRHRLFFSPNNGQYEVIADGQLVERAARLTNASVILRQVLFIHQ